MKIYIATNLRELNGMVEKLMQTFGSGCKWYGGDDESLTLCAWNDKEQHYIEVA